MDIGDTLTPLFEATSRGEAGARQQLFAALYQELRRLASAEVRRHGSGIVSATTLLHETYLAVAERGGASFPDRHRFMAYAARAMRGLIIDFARERYAQKRGGGWQITALKTDLAPPGPAETDLPQLDEALNQLAGRDEELAQLVDLKFFCGFTFAEIAQMRGESERTVQRDWEKARLLLHDSMHGEGAVALS